MNGKIALVLGSVIGTTISWGAVLQSFLGGAAGAIGSILIYWTWKKVNQLIKNRAEQKQSDE